MLNLNRNVKWKAKTSRSISITTFFFTFFLVVRDDTIYFCFHRRSNLLSNLNIHKTSNFSLKSYNFFLENITVFRRNHNLMPRVIQILYTINSLAGNGANKIIILYCPNDSLTAEYTMRYRIYYTCRIISGSYYGLGTGNKRKSGSRKSRTLRTSYEGILKCNIIIVYFPFHVTVCVFFFY